MSKTTCADLITSKGYPLEEHFVTTDDGYILRLFRVKHGLRKNSPSGAAGADGSNGCHGKGRLKRRCPVVHLQHGLLGASSDWALNGPGFSLVFLLADAGACRSRRLIDYATRLLLAAALPRPQPRPPTSKAPAPNPNTPNAT